MSKIFIPHNSSFKEYTEGAGKSINDISISLGYHPDQLHTYFGDFDDQEISCVALEVFTRDIVFLVSKSETISSRAAAHFFRNFKLEDEYSSYNAESILEEGIKNKSLRIEFLARTLNIRNASPDGIFNIPTLELDLAFSNGILTDFFSADGLNTAARHWKQLNPDFIGSYKKEAEYYRGNSIKDVLYEINSQAEAYSETPQALLNEFAPLHRSKFGNVNFAMLMVCHYGKKISLTEFKKINHGRFEVISADELLSYRKFNFEFDEFGTLEEVRLIE